MVTRMKKHTSHGLNKMVYENIAQIVLTTKIKLGLSNYTESVPNWIWTPANRITSKGWRVMT